MSLSPLTIIIGHTGSGKTYTAYKILRDAGYDEIVEVNSTMSAQNIKDTLKIALTTTSILGILRKKKRYVGIIIDDIDILNIDKNLQSEIYSLLEKPHESPVICTAKTILEKKLRKLSKSATIIETIPNLKELSLSLDKPYKILKKIAKTLPTPLDIRELIQTLNGFQSQEKEIDYGLYELVDRLVNREISIEEQYRLFHMEDTLIPFMIHENYLKAPIDLIDKAKIARSLLEYDLMIEKLYSGNEYYVDTAYYGAIKPCSILGKHNLEINYTTLYPKTLLQFSNQKFIDELCSSLVMDIDELTILGCYLSKLLFDKMDYKTVILELKSRLLTVNNLCDIIRLSKLRGIRHNKILTITIKKKLEKLFIEED